MSHAIQSIRDGRLHMMAAGIQLERRFWQESGRAGLHSTGPLPEAARPLGADSQATWAAMSGLRCSGVHVFVCEESKEDKPAGAPA